jgi:hypothetical protein
MCSVFVTNAQNKLYCAQHILDIVSSEWRFLVIKSSPEWLKSLLVNIMAGLSGRCCCKIICWRIVIVTVTWTWRVHQVANKVSALILMTESVETVIRSTAHGQNTDNEWLFFSFSGKADLNIDLEGLSKTLEYFELIYYN